MSPPGAIASCMSVLDMSLFVVIPGAYAGAELSMIPAASSVASALICAAGAKFPGMSDAVPARTAIPYTLPFPARLAIVIVHVAPVPVMFIFPPVTVASLLIVMSAAVSVVSMAPVYVNVYISSFFAAFVSGPVSVIVGAVLSNVTLLPSVGADTVAPTLFSASLYPEISNVTIPSVSISCIVYVAVQVSFAPSIAVMFFPAYLYSRCVYFFVCFEC